MKVSLFCLLYSIFLMFAASEIKAQCCAGASPIAGNTNISILEQGQFEVSALYQYTYGDKTYRGDTLNNVRLYRKVYNHYTYLSLGYGLSDHFSFYSSLGYYPEKTEVLMADTISGKGISALLLFPKYKLLAIKKHKTKTELTLGLGMKIPLGAYDQSRVIYVNPHTGEEISAINGPAVQPSTGSNDFIFNLQMLRAYTEQTLYLFADLTYLRRGVNPLGQNFGDIKTAILNMGKNITHTFGLALEAKCEQTDSLIDPLWPSTQSNTGYTKVALSPTIHFVPAKNITLTAYVEYPLYQYMRGVQIATKYIALVSLNYRVPMLRQAEGKAADD